MPWFTRLTEADMHLQQAALHVPAMLQVTSKSK
jgi:hypothetical protein